MKRVHPVPLGAIHSTRDEFVALAEVQKILDAAREPKRLWIIKAADHRFSDNLSELDRRLLEAIAWIAQQTFPQTSQQTSQPTPRPTSPPSPYPRPE